MNRTRLFIVFIWTFSGTVANADDYGFPTLNSVGRYFGVGWSHHTYHSQVDGRFNIVSNRHPACAYPSSSLSHFYSPDYGNYPPGQLLHSPAGGFWQAPTVVNSPSILEPENKARKVEPKNRPQDLVPPEVIDLPRPKESPKPQQPPPGWLKPYLEDDKAKSKRGDLIELEPSPSDKT